MSVLELRTDAWAKARANGLALAFGALVLALVAALVLLTGPRVEARPVTAPLIAPTRAAALIEATSGDAAIEVTAVGDAAQLINAALPFATGPVPSARPFALGGDGLDYGRALLCLTQAV